MHRFPRRTAALLTMFAAALTSAAAAQTDTAKSRPADLPPAEEILARSLEARGGKDKLKAVTSEHMVGSFSMTGMPEGDLKIFRKAPNQMKIAISLPQMGEVEQAYDGKNGWVLQMGQAMVLSGDQLEQMKDQAVFNREVDFKKHFKSMETVEKTEFDGKTCYAVKTVSQMGMEEMRYYDIKTGLPTGTVTKMEGQFGPMENTTYLRDYKEVEGVMFPMTMQVDSAMGAQVLKVREIKINTLDKDAFAMPDAVKQAIDGGN